MRDTTNFSQYYYANKKGIKFISSILSMLYIRFKKLPTVVQSTSVQRGLQTQHRHPTSYVTHSYWQKFSHTCYRISSSSLSSCSWRVRCVSCSLILKMKLVPPSLPRSSYVPSSFWFITYCSACFGSLFVSILCTCCSHFFWYCFISFTIFCALVFCLIH